MRQLLRKLRLCFNQNVKRSNEDAVDIIAGPATDIRPDKSSKASFPQPSSS